MTSKEVCGFSGVGYTANAMWGLLTRQKPMQLSVKPLIYTDARSARGSMTTDDINGAEPDVDERRSVKVLVLRSSLARAKTTLCRNCRQLRQPAQRLGTRRQASLQAPMSPDLGGFSQPSTTTKR